MFDRETVSYRVKQILTALGIRKSGFFTPFAYASSVSSEVPAYEAVEAFFEGSIADFKVFLESIKTTLPDFRKAVEENAIPFEECGMFPKLDSIAAYHLVRERKPTRVVEIGSGASTHVLARALNDNQHGNLLCIDPKPRRSIESTGAEVHCRTLSTEDAKLVENFEPNDVLFIDSSHVMLPGMDVDIQFNRMFPALPSGALVHVHDIFLPDSYPVEWNQRMFSEQNALIGWILSGFFEVIFPSYYVATRLEPELKEVLQDITPINPQQNAGSIWLKRI
ncbi:class I SAM-dependent methyltransferase [Marimonas arenosa]|uniref:Class I SAM-dependent methyltransferase n=1 Tax=Marimonas arenosa TaxID=1795305 RepID=A0AAE3WBY6_9RHOB|nr:class I SAM-dependent methyltransferase [Marimonas arenosa]MDQ2089678.1 class I SAM-dependent methyltransferase [Marimonas arenosa]